jgi:ribulose-5-phosphate 4-epimerase/fuculose-1-phosphate aldolase
MKDKQVLVRKAARALARHGLVNAYGHCSARIDDKAFLVCPPKPMGLIEPEEDCTTVQIDAPLPKGVLGEVRVHQQIYKRRRDTLEQAVTLAWYLEDMARVELDVLSAKGGVPKRYSTAEALQRATFEGNVIERMWEYLTAGDPE